MNLPIGKWIKDMNRQFSEGWSQIQMVDKHEKMFNFLLKKHKLKQ